MYQLFTISFKHSNHISDTVYDLNLSIDVIDSVSHIPHFTRIQEALKTAIETKRKLNIKEDQEHARLQLNSKQAARANRSISQNEPAEGYICPVCMLALSNQDALILHWQENHNIEKFENDTIQQEDGNALGESNDARSPNTLEAVSDSNYTIKSDNDLAVIDIPQQKVHRAYSDCEDVVKSFVDDEDMLNATAENADVSSKENYSIGKETEERIAPSSWSLFIFRNMEIERVNWFWYELTRSSRIYTIQTEIDSNLSDFL